MSKDALFWRTSGCKKASKVLKSCLKDIEKRKEKDRLNIDIMTWKDAPGK